MLNRLYYFFKPAIPRSSQIAIRRWLVKRKKRRAGDLWPINSCAGHPPRNWPGWPNRKQFAVVLTHDVESSEGQNKCRKLMNIEKGLGFRSSFNFVPERYRVSSGLRYNLKESGFEVGVHGLNHDGKLYQSRQVFSARASRINGYLADWGVGGFRSPAMHHNLEWLHELDIDYDASTFDTDPFEPQSDGVGTIFPFWVSDPDSNSGYAELPYTLVQDFTLFVLMQEKTIDLWKKKVDWIACNGGMVLLNTHPDYMQFPGEKAGLETFHVKLYIELLNYITHRFANRY